MEAAAASVSAARGVALPQPSRKEWRAVSEQSFRHPCNNDTVRSKLGQNDERLIYEVQQGGEPADVDFCSITIDGGGLDNDILQQRLHSVVKQREELQHMEIDLHVQLISRSEIMKMRSNFDAQIKEHANANAKLQEQLREREQKIFELERKMDEKERELHAIRLDNEAQACYKEDLLREQSKELQTYRRERDNTEAERAQYIKQIHELQEHFQEKERKFIELQEQNRVAQETILFKDEQLKEAQAWISRAQEMDALQRTTNHSLQAELRERTEQYNQLWVGCQRQFGEIERLHLHIQQLQLELASAREKSGTYSDSSRVDKPNSNDVVHLTQSNGSGLDVNGSVTPGGNSSSLPSGNADNASSIASAGSSSTATDQIHGVPMAPSTLVGMPPYFTPGQMSALHPYGVHNVPQSHVGHFHSIPALSSLHHWQNQQVLPEGQQLSSQVQSPHPQNDSTTLISDSNGDYKASVHGQLQSDYLDVDVNQGFISTPAVQSSNENGQVLESVDNNYLAGTQSQNAVQQISSQFHDNLRLDSFEGKTGTRDKSAILSANLGVEEKPQMSGKPSPATSQSTEVSSHNLNSSEKIGEATTVPVLPESTLVSSGQKSTYLSRNSAESALLDERSLLACIVRTIPPGSGGRISVRSTLPNRLGKMLAPLHWHDYKKKYGKLDEFVASHPELFAVDGDYIQLREGAQEILAATTAVAKVAAAAKTSHPSLLPSVAVTPIAQPHRVRKGSSVESSFQNALDNSSELLPMQSQLQNGVPFHDGGGFSNVKILTKPKVSTDPAQSIASMGGNRISSDQMGNSQSSVSYHVRSGASSRAYGTASNSKR